MKDVLTNRLYLKKSLAFTEMPTVHLSNNAAGRLLGCQRRLPRLVNEFVGEFAQLRQIFADVLSAGVSLLTKGHGAVNPI